MPRGYDDKGSKIIVEMQRAKMEHFRERVYFYASKVIAAKEVKGIWNYGLEPTYSVSFLNFNTPPTWMGCKSVMHYVTRGEEGDKMPGSTEFFLFDLNNFEKESKNINKYLKKWLSLLRDSKLWKEIPAEYQGDEEFAQYFEASRRAAFTAEENQKYVEDMMNEWDIETSKREAVEEALAKGISEGMAKGEAKGKAEGKAETIVNCYKAGITAELLSQATGYSIDQINEILATHNHK